VPTRSRLTAGVHTRYENGVAGQPDMLLPSVPQFIDTIILVFQLKEREAELAWVGRKLPPIGPIGTFPDRSLEGCVVVLP
jgi:hypothetical protein